jgi:hypothetical protein
VRNNKKLLANNNNAHARCGSIVLKKSVLANNATFSVALVRSIVFSAVMYRVYEAPARVATRTLLGRFIDPGASRADNYFPIALCVGVPVVLSIFGWFISLR